MASNDFTIHTRKFCLATSATAEIASWEDTKSFLPVSASGDCSQWVPDTRLLQTGYQDVAQRRQGTHCCCFCPCVWLGIHSGMPLASPFTNFLLAVLNKTSSSAQTLACTRESSDLKLGLYVYLSNKHWTHTLNLLKRRFRSHECSIFFPFTNCHLPSDPRKRLQSMHITLLSCKHHTTFCLQARVLAPDFQTPGFVHPVTQPNPVSSPDFKLLLPYPSLRPYLGHSSVPKPILVSSLNPIPPIPSTTHVSSVSAQSG